MFVVLNLVASKTLVLPSSSTAPEHPADLQHPLCLRAPPSPQHPALPSLHRHLPPRWEVPHGRHRRGDLRVAQRPPHPVAEDVDQEAATTLFHILTDQIRQNGPCPRSRIPPCQPAWPRSCPASPSRWTRTPGGHRPLPHGLQPTVSAAKKAEANSIRSLHDKSRTVEVKGGGNYQYRLGFLTASRAVELW